MGERAIEVRVTLLEEESNSNNSDRGKRMAEALEKLAAINAIAEIDPVAC